jgi:hypothetical protein
MQIMRVKRQVERIPNVPRSFGSGVQETFDSVMFAAVVLASAKGMKSRANPRAAILVIIGIKRRNDASFPKGYGLPCQQRK